MDRLLSSDNIQTLSFFILVAFFGLLEKFRPAREINRWKDLKIDVLSFAIGVTLSRLCYSAIYNFCDNHLGKDTLLIWHGIMDLPAAVKIGMALVATDFALYWVHRLQHSNAFMWRTHTWHHSIEELYWFSGFRTSFMHSLIYNIPQTIIPMFVFKLTPLEAGIGYSIGIFVQFWEHTNTDFNIGFLKYIFITPAYHRVHHSINIHNRNYGTTFSFWDRMFGTYHDPDLVPKDTKLGLGEELTTPKITRMLTGF